MGMENCHPIRTNPPQIVIRLAKVCDLVNTLKKALQTVAYTDFTALLVAGPEFSPVEGC
jgi:hypothetical protein